MMSRLPVVWRRSWNRSGRTTGFTQSFRPSFGHPRCSSSGALSTWPQPCRRQTSLATPPDPALLEPTGSSHLPGFGTPGDGGKDVFTFRGVSAGQTSPVATATRTFSGETESYVLTVVVGTAPSAVSGVVVGSAGLPAEGARVVSGHPAVTAGVDGAPRPRSRS